MAENIIEVESLTKFYGERKGIENISFTVAAGDIFGFIGPNGAGKTTTIRTLLALLRPTSGGARIFGLDCIAEARSIAGRVGYLPAEPYYYDRMKVRDLLSYAADLYGVDPGSRIETLSERLRLDRSRKIADLSTGNKKKVGIVSALLHKPELLILDEPTSGLDPLVQQEFFEIIREENRNGMTVLFSSHVLGDVQKISNKVAILKNGGIVTVHGGKELHEFEYRKINLTAGGEIPDRYFSLPGIADCRVEGRNASFICKGEIAEVIHLVDGLKVRDITIQEPSLEEIFLHYYR